MLYLDWRLPDSLRKPPMGRRIKIVNYMKFVECNTIPLGMWLIDGLELRSELIVLIYQKVSIFFRKDRRGSKLVRSISREF